MRKLRWNYEETTVNYEETTEHEETTVINYEETTVKKKLPKKNRDVVPLSVF